MRELSVSTQQFSWIVSSYGFSAAVVTLVGSRFFDLFDRKRLLLFGYAGFIVATAACGLANSYETLLLARILPGAFGGLSAVGIMVAIGDLFAPQVRGTATGAVLSAFAVASIAGLPIGLQLALWYGRGAPFLVLAAVSCLVWMGVAIWLPPMRKHLEADSNGQKNPTHPGFAKLIREPNHWRAFLWTGSLVFGTFTVIPFLGPYMTANVGRAEADLPIIYMSAGLATFISMNLIGRLSDRFGKRLLFRLMAVSSLIVMLITTNLPAVSLPIACMVAALFMVTASGRMVPAQAMMIGSARPEVRGAFLSVNTSVQHFCTGVAPMISGIIMNQNTAGQLVGYNIVGYVAASFALLSLWLSKYVRQVPEKPAQLKSESQVEPKPELGPVQAVANAS